MWRFDRFSRSVSHLCRALEIFNALKINFVSMIEQIDTSDSSRHIRVSCSRERWHRASGRRLLSACGQGFETHERRASAWASNEVPWTLTRINSLRASGHSWRTIARDDEASVGTVYTAARPVSAR